MMESQFSPTLVMEHLGMLRRRNIDGVVLFGFTGITEELIAPESLAGAAGKRCAGFASVCYDDEGAIHILMQRLYEQGHRNISFLGVPIAILPPANVGMTHTAFCKNINFTPSPPCPVLP